VELICGWTTPYRGPASFSIISTPSACHLTQLLLLGKAQWPCIASLRVSVTMNRLRPEKATHDGSSDALSQ
jgi:hypothetical protein